MHHENAEEIYCLEMIRLIQVEYQKQIDPHLKRLVAIRSIQHPQYVIFLDKEKAPAGEDRD